MSFKVIQGHRFWYQSKAHMDFLLVINTNLPPILHRFRDIAFDKSKIAIYLATSLAFNAPDGGFLANVNSRSRSLYTVARPSVVCLSSVVCNVRAPYSGGSNFRQYFYGIRYPGHPLTSTENFMEVVPGEPLRRGS